tara:strand:- start:4051 stop:5343 length:1293 start_codon:yes stop_codon:yes gene_type:complete
MKKIVINLTVYLSILYSQHLTTYVLCEGNFGNANSSLWSFNNLTEEEINGPIHWDENSNPLGDVGQSMTINNNKLYIVMNSSHSIEVMNLYSGFAIYETTLNLANASPRYMTIKDNYGYLSCWNLNGILVINLNNHEIMDTIFVNGMPEVLIQTDNHLYASIPNKVDWSTNNQILKIDTELLSVIDSFTVSPGPSSMILDDSKLYIACSSYDSDWNTYASNSRIDLMDGTVINYDAGLTSDYGSDIILFQNKVYRVFNGGLVPINEDLTMNISEKIGNYSNLYSASSYGDYLYFGLSDYVAPDTIMVLNSNGEVIIEHQVSALPGSFAFDDQTLNSLGNSQLAKKIEVIKNYPNPFNPITNINFELNKFGFTNLYIVNIKGQIIESLIKSNLMEGSHNIKWNGSLVPSGIYFAVLENDQNKTVKKMSLIK